VTISENEIRAALLKQLIRRAKTSRVQEELRIEQGASRIDVAVIGKRLLGYEIKSDSDTFLRFSNQIHSYNRVFDEITLICGSKHVVAAELVIPSWWGLILAQRNAMGAVTLEKLRGASTNAKQDAFSLASMLWKEEALQFLDNKAAPGSKRASSDALWEQIALTFPLAAIKSFVKQALVKRTSTIVHRP
jgi:hypothetical protein